MRYYLDADLSQRVARIVRELAPEIDIASAQELRHVRVPDAEELAYATQERRCLVTRNYADYDRLTDLYQAQGRQHAGVLFVPPSLANADFGGLARAIVQHARANPGPAPPNFVDYLRPVDR